MVSKVVLNQSISNVISMLTTFIMLDIFFVHIFIHIQNSNLNIYVEQLSNIKQLFKF